jgi:hypothetical protein
LAIRWIVDSFGFVHHALLLFHEALRFNVTLCLKFNGGVPRGDIPLLMMLTFLAEE